MSVIPSTILNQLIEALRCLPGVGPKSAQRMAFHLLEHDRGGAVELSDSLKIAVEKIVYCTQCRTLSESQLCGICRDEARITTTLCVIESPSDVLAIEKSTDYNGRYFVLMGHLSPLDGIGPNDIGLDLLEQRMSKGKIAEIILATNPTVEGGATANYIAELAKSYDIKVMRIAQGIPLGGELKFVDGGTLSQAFAGRIEIK